MAAFKKISSSPTWCAADSLKALIAQAFMNAHGVEYRTAPSIAKIQAANIADMAKSYTVQVECVR